MKYKTATYIANTIIISISVFLLFVISNFSRPVIRLPGVGPGYYPALLCIGLILTSIASLIKTYKSGGDRLVVFPKIGNSLVITAVLVAFLVLWNTTGQFYIVSFLSMAILLYFLNPQPNNAAKVVKAVLLSLSMQVFIYVVFQRLMYFRF